MREPCGVILAGGQGRRMGNVSKSDLRLGGRRLVDLALERLGPQVSEVAINANGALKTDALVIPDRELPGHGPLSGILTALRWADEEGATHVVTAAVDTPFFPADLVPRLILAAEEHPEGLALAATTDGVHGTFGIWPVDLADDLAAALRDGVRKVTDWTYRQGAALAYFPETNPPSFFNINTPEHLERAEGWV